MRTTPHRRRHRTVGRLLTLALALPLSAVLTTPALAAPAEQASERSQAAAGAPPGAAGTASTSPAGGAGDGGTAPGQERKADAAGSGSAAPPANGRAAKDEAPRGSSRGTSGDERHPQPVSHADSGGKGANPGGSAGGACSGHDYCSTRDGSDSGNGLGGGQATGKPCAGCVGKADNKNPPGQYKDGGDANNGYECDGNKGIARTNPAHTGCKRPSEPPPTCVDQLGTPCTPTTPPVCTPTATDPCTPGTPVCDPAVEDCDEEPSVLPTTQTRTPAVVAPSVVRAFTPPAVLSRTVTAPAATPAALPFTGGELVTVLPLALSAVALGALLVRAGRRRAGATSW